MNRTLTMTKRRIKIARIFDIVDDVEKTRHKYKGNPGSSPLFIVLHYLDLTRPFGDSQFIKHKSNTEHFHYLHLWLTRESTCVLKKQAETSCIYGARFERKKLFRFLDRHFLESVRWRTIQLQRTYSPTLSPLQY